MRRRPHFLLFGRILPFERMEGAGEATLTSKRDRRARIRCHSHSPGDVRSVAGVFAGSGRDEARMVLCSSVRRVYIVGSGTAPPSEFSNSSAWRCVPLFFDVQDNPRIQFRDLEIKERRARESLRRSGEISSSRSSTFRLLGFPSREQFAEMYEIDESRKVMTPNAADPWYMEVTPLPDGSVVGLVGGARHGRGADLLIEACAIARKEMSELKLRLALGNVSGRGYLGELIAQYAGRRGSASKTSTTGDCPSSSKGCTPASCRIARAATWISPCR